MKFMSLVIAAALVAALVPCRAPHLAANANASTSDGTVVSSAGTSEPSATESAVGAIAAILCGVSVKAAIAAGGTSVPVNAVAIGSCTLALFDALTDED